MRQTTILVIGTADTKADEMLFLRSVIESQGGDAPIMDVGVLGDPPFAVQYSKHEVAGAAGSSNAQIIALGDENLAMSKTAEGASNLCQHLYHEGKIDGILLLGGTMGTDLALEVALALPIGLPKLIISTVAFSHLIPPDRLSPDLMMILWSGGLYGLNSLCKAVLSQAAGAVLGAARAVQKPQFDKPLIAISSLGSSALSYMLTLKPELEARGYEVVVFHTTGQGGRALENLAAEKAFVAIFDFSLAEVANYHCGSIVNSGKDRLENAGLAAIPQLVAPGGLGIVDIATWQARSPEQQTRGYHAHNRLIASISSTAEEMADIAQAVAHKLNQAKGPTAFVMPLKGLIAWDREGEPLHAPELLQAFAQSLKINLVPSVKLLELDAHINDALFSQQALAIFDAWVSAGYIPKGLKTYHD
ncbi:MAG: Tm-1-like ATP-binding domain-containing protein [Deinococcales bacterium]